MDNEPEVIKQQMDETRSALTEKIEQLEKQVTETVQDATSAVSETVDSVKQAVQETVDTVKDTVQGTVETVKETVHDTVETVKDTLDLPKQVKRRPWVMVAGATALGFLGGYLLAPSGRERRSRERVAGGDHYGRSRAGMESYYEAGDRRTGNGRGNGPTLPTSATPPSASAVSAMSSSSGTASTKEPGLLDSFGHTFQAELDQLKGMAVGAMVGLFRDLLTRAVPPTMGQQLHELLDNVTTKLGGKPIRGSVLPEDQTAKSGTRTEQTETSSQRCGTGI